MAAKLHKMSLVAANEGPDCAQKIFNPAPTRRSRRAGEGGEQAAGKVITTTKLQGAATFRNEVRGLRFYEVRGALCVLYRTLLHGLQRFTAKKTSEHHNQYQEQRISQHRKSTKSNK
jgi:hypothetical protein